MRAEFIKTAVGDGILHDPPARRRLAEVLRTPVAEERLKVFDGVTLDAGDHSALDHHVQVDKGMRPRRSSSSATSQVAYRPMRRLSAAGS